MHSVCLSPENMDSFNAAPVRCIKWAVYCILYISAELKQPINFVNVTIPSWEIFIWSDSFSKTASSWKMQRSGQSIVKRWATWGIPWERCSLWSFCRFPCSPPFSPLAVWTSWLHRKRGRSAMERCTSGFYGHVAGNPAPVARHSISFKRGKKLIIDHDIF